MDGAGAWWLSSAEIPALDGLEGALPVLDFGEPGVAGRPFAAAGEATAVGDDTWIDAGRFGGDDADDGGDMDSGCCCCC